MPKRKRNEHHVVSLDHPLMQQLAANRRQQEERREKKKIKNTSGSKMERFIHEFTTGNLSNASKRLISSSRSATQKNLLKKLKKYEKNKSKLEPKT